ncbi:MAG: hypothetical protein WBB19_10740 [Desulforhopalus sp.]
MINNIKQQLHSFFPGEVFQDEDVEEGLADGDIFVEKRTILPFLQTALLDEKVLEVELDGKPRVYFSRLKDDRPEQADGEMDYEADSALYEEDDYNEGDYLTAMSHIVTLPLEPGLGNLYLRHSRFIVIRMFTNAYAVELATTFDQLAKVGDLPVLRLSFPTLARIVRNAREFRAKVPENLDFIVNIQVDKTIGELDTTPVDISIKGMAFSVSKDEQKMFPMSSVHTFKLIVNDELVALLKGSVKHLSKVRKKGGIEYVCGIEFDLETPILAAVVEATVASVQRAHLKDLAEKSDASGIDLIA